MQRPWSKCTRDVPHNTADGTYSVQMAVQDRRVSKPKIWVTGTQWNVALIKGKKRRGRNQQATR